MCIYGGIYIGSKWIKSVPMLKENNTKIDLSIEKGINTTKTTKRDEIFTKVLQCSTEIINEKDGMFIDMIEKEVQDLKSEINDVSIELLEMERRLLTVDLYVNSVKQHLDKTVEIMNDNRAFKNKSIYIPAFKYELIQIAVFLFLVGVLIIIIGWYVHEFIMDCVGRNQTL